MIGDEASSTQPDQHDLQETMRAQLTSRVVDPTVVGLFTLLVGVVAAGRPSFSADEAATISASTRSLRDLDRLVTSVDAVHAAYYVLMHGWFQVAPHTEAWSRVPSCLACGGAAAGVVVLGKLLADRPTGLASGFLFAVLPGPHGLPSKHARSLSRRWPRCGSPSSLCSPRAVTPR